LAVERHPWPEAAALALPPGVFPGGRYSSTEMDLYFAKALGAARMGDTAAAHSNLGQMDALYARLEQNHDTYSSQLVDIQRASVNAWIAYAEGKTDDAIRQMRSAADREDATEKLPVTPGAIIPARELLGEMLLDAKRPSFALEAFESSLKLAPQRLNSLLGAARAAQSAGDVGRAKRYYSQVLASCPHPSTDRPYLREASLFLNQK